MPWEAIKYVSGGFTLCAFFVAALLTYLKSRTQEERKRIETALPKDRAYLVAKTLEVFDVKTEGLPPDRQFEIAMRQINGRIERFRLVAIVVVILAIIGAGLSAYAITVENKSTDPTKPAVEDHGDPAGQTPSKPERSSTTAPKPPVDTGADTTSQHIDTAPQHVDTASQRPDVASERPDTVSQRSNPLSEHRSAEMPRLDKTPVLIKCDADCTVTIDGKNVGSLKANASTLQELSSGDHIIEATDQTGAATWTRNLRAHGTDQIIATIELQKMIFARNAAWLVGRWERQTTAEPDNDSARTCFEVMHRVSRLSSFLSADGQTLSIQVDFSKTSTFPNDGGYPDVCAEHRSDEEAHFMYLVTSLSTQTAQATLTNAGQNYGHFQYASYCSSSCRTITVSRKSDSEIELHGIPFAFFTGEYERAN